MPTDYRSTSVVLSQRATFAGSWLARSYRAVVDRRVLKSMGGGSMILDVGAGEGILLEKVRLSEPTRFSVALDRHPLNAEICASLGLPSIVGDAESLPLREGSFGVVLLTNMLEHVDNPRAALEDARRVIRHDGVLIVLVPHEGNFRRARRLLGRGREAELDYGHVTAWDPPSLAELVRETGFRIEKQLNLPLPWWPLALHHMVVASPPHDD